MSQDRHPGGLERAPGRRSPRRRRGSRRCRTGRADGRAGGSRDPGSAASRARRGADAAERQHMRGQRFALGLRQEAAAEPGVENDRARPFGDAGSDDAGVAAQRMRRGGPRPRGRRAPAETPRTALPSLATCRGSMPRSSPAARTAAVTGTAALLEDDPDAGSSRPSRGAPRRGRRESGPSWPRSAPPAALEGGADQPVDGRDVRDELPFELERVTRRHDREAVIPDRPGDDDPVARIAGRSRGRGGPSSRCPSCSARCRRSRRGP